MLRFTLTLLAALTIVMGPVTSSASTFNVIFTGVGALPSGTVTYAADGPGNLAPIAFRFSDGNSVWTQDDEFFAVFGSGWNTQWAGSLPTSFLDDDPGPGTSDLGQNNIRDVFEPPASPSGDSLVFSNFDFVCRLGPVPTVRWCSGFSSSGPVNGGTYSFARVPEPAHPTLAALAVLALGLRRRRTAVR